MYCKGGKQTGYSTVKLFFLFTIITILTACSGGGGGNDGNSNSGVTIELAWDNPLDRVNGTALPETEIAGYRIEYRKEGDTTYTTDNVDSGVKSYQIDNLQAGQKYTFRVATIDTDNTSSQFALIEQVVN